MRRQYPSIVMFVRSSIHPLFFNAFRYLENFLTASTFKQHWSFFHNRLFYHLVLPRNHFSKFLITPYVLVSFNKISLQLQLIKLDTDGFTIKWSWVQFLLQTGFLFTILKYLIERVLSHYLCVCNKHKMDNKKRLVNKLVWCWQHRQQAFHGIFTAVTSLIILSRHIEFFAYLSLLKKVNSLDVNSKLIFPPLEFLMHKQQRQKVKDKELESV